MAPRPTSLIWRIHALRVGATIAFLIVIAEALVLLWPSHRERWVQRAERQFFTKIELPGERGLIYDRNGDPLALNVPGLILYQTQDSVRLPEALRSTYGIQPVKHVPPKGARLLAYGLPYTVKRLLQSQDSNVNDGLWIEFAWIRKYPCGPATSSLLGVVGRDGYGLGGVEYFFNDYLTGRPGYRQVFRSAGGVKFTLPDLPRVNPQPGHPLYLTIDRTIQELAYEVLERRVREVEAQWGYMIVTNPQTGEILAMVNVPSPDPNQPGIPRYPTNHAITDPYEPGSTFKVVLYTLAYERHIISPQDSVETSPGWVQFGRYRIHDVHNLGKVTYREALVHSSNVAASLLSLQVDAKSLFEMAQRFGIGCPTGISLPGEFGGKVRPLSKWTDLYKANFSIGHGVLVTGIQMAMLYGAIANGGLLLQPRLILGGTHTPRVIRRVTRPGVLDTLTSILEGVVEEGTGRRAKIPGLRIAGKTGTTEKVDPTTGRYSKTKSITSFIGFFPVEAPQYLIVVVINEPKKGRFGGDVAAPAFREMALRLLHLDLVRQPGKTSEELRDETL